MPFRYRVNTASKRRVNSHSLKSHSHCVDRKSVYVCLFGFLTSLSTTRLYRGRAPRESIGQFYVLPHMRQSWETITSVSAGHILSGGPQRESNHRADRLAKGAVSSSLAARPRVCWLDLKSKVNNVQWHNLTGSLEH